MLRRTAAKMNKAPQTPGPTMQGWGRTAQKRRLEYETVENKYGKREFNKNWDLAGLEVRMSEASEQRVYFNYPQRMAGWVFNLTSTYATSWVGGASVIGGLHIYTKHVDAETKHAAWW